MNELTFTLVQTPLLWENKQGNLLVFETVLRDLNPETDVIVLPEMFTTGFSMQTQFAETMDGASIQWMREQSQKYKSVICGSLMIQEGNQYHNRFVWMEPTGEYQYYDKRHLFNIGKEHIYYTPGHERKVIAYKGWNIAPAICYDLRFPVWLKRSPEYEYDILLFVANWPEKRSSHWRSLLQARAIENQSFLVAVNRIGKDNQAINHIGNSGVINPQGEWMLEKMNEAGLFNITILKKELVEWRHAFPVEQDADSFNLNK